MGLAYRADIDGLRAIAVIAVVLFHGHIPPFRGGFVGVDVFFVISGFLITSILYRDMETGRYSLVDFYDRRIRRIFPALFVMMAGVTALASFVLLPNQMLDYARSLAPSALFYANIHFMNVLDYFGPDASEVPLLHLWSLAVEEQFYIVFPILLFGVLRFGGRRLAVGMLVAIAIASLALSQFWVLADPKFAFYQLASRAWELLLGAFLALAPLPRVRTPVATAIGAAGLVGVLIPIFLYSDSTGFPGLAAVPPVLGTALLVYAGAHAPRSPITRLLSLPGMVYVGRISYSLYLWHWPLLVLAAMYKTWRLTYIQSGLVILLAVALSALSLKYVETPLRQTRLLGGRRLARIGAGALVILCTIGAARALEGVNGQLWPVSPRGAAAFANLRTGERSPRPCGNDANKWNALPPIEKCATGPGAKEGTYDVAVWGDSHAGALYKAIADEVTELGFTVRSLIMPACPPLIGGRALRNADNGERCARFNAAVMDEIQRVRPKLVVLVSRWSMWTVTAGSSVALTTTEIPNARARTKETSLRVMPHMLKRTLNELSAAVPHVIVVGQVPEYPTPPTGCVAHREYFGGDSSACLKQPQSEALKLVGYSSDVITRMAAAYPNVQVIKLSDILCQDGTCVAGSLTPGEERFFYRDEHHLSSTGARFVKEDPHFAWAIAAALQAPDEARTLSESNPER